MKIIQNNPFTASWDKSNAKLNPNNDGILWKLARKVKNLVFYIPTSIVAACINPRKESKFYSSATLDKNHGRFSKEIITPDKVHLSAWVHIVEKADSNTPTVILFNPLGADDSIHINLRAYLAVRKMQYCNI